MQLIRIVVGFCVTFVILCFVAGGVTMAAQILTLLIVCTAGISLVVLIPMWWIVGWLGWWTQAFVGEFRTKVDKDLSKAKHENEVVGGTDLALEGYLRKADAKGIDQEKTTFQLQAAGWTKAEIQKARQNVGSSLSKTNRA